MQKEEEEEIKLSDIIGGLGKYQICLLLIVFSCSALYGISCITLVLISPEVNMYWDWEATNPNKTLFKSVECKMEDIMKHNRTSNLSGPSSKLIYTSSYSKSTLTEELNMVCERSWLISLGNAVFTIGIISGSAILGRLTEIFGRRLCTIWILIIATISSILILFPKGYVMLVLSLFVNGATAVNACTFIFIEVLEIIPTKWSQYIGTFAKSGMLLGQTIFVGFAWIMEDWFYTQIFQVTFTGALTFTLFYTFESPVWLAVRKRYKEAKDVILSIAKRNGLDHEAIKPNVDAYLKQMKIRCEIQGKAEKGKYTDLFKNRLIVIYCFGMAVTFISISVIFTSLTLNVETFGSGLYVELTISNAVSLASILLALIVLRRFSIRIQLGACCFGAGIVCAIFPFVYGNHVARSALAILGRCFMAIPRCFCFIYLNEVFPTSLRGVSTGFIFAIAGVVSALAPFTKELGETAGLYVPFIIFAVLGFVSAGIYKAMPETKGQELIHTVDELLVRKQTTSPIYTISGKYNIRKISTDTA